MKFIAVYRRTLEGYIGFVEKLSGVSRHKLSSSLFPGNLLP